MNRKHRRTILGQIPYSSGGSINSAEMVEKTTTGEITLTTGVDRDRTINKTTDGHTGEMIGTDGTTISRTADGTMPGKTMIEDQKNNTGLADEPDGLQRLVSCNRSTEEKQRNA